VPRAVPVSEAGQEYVASLDIPLEYRERFIEVQNNLNTVLGGYPNYVYIAFNPDGTEEDAQPVFDRLAKAKYSRYERGEDTPAELRERCLSSSDPGGKRSPTTNPMSLCIVDLPFMENPLSSDPSVPFEKRYAKMALYLAHEYFHHYQRAHALDRGLDYQTDQRNPTTTVQAPRWWIEGAADTFQDAWYQANWQSLSFLNDPSARDVSISSVSSSRKYKSVRRSIMGTSSEDTWEGCSPEWYMTTAEETHDTWSDCRANKLATAYLAYKTSYKTVWIDIPQDYYDLGFWGAFEKHVGMTKQEFYDEYNAFLRTGGPEDEPPAGWAPPKGPISAYADFLQIIPESDQTAMPTLRPTLMPDASFYFDRALNYERVDDYENAIQDYDRAIQLDPNDSQAYKDRGRAYYKRGQYQRAIQDYDGAIQLDPNFATAYNNRSDAYYNLGKYAEADADKAKACSLDTQYG